MSIRIENKTIFLAVRDLVSVPPKRHISLSPFPIPKRGWLGIQAQKKAQAVHGLFHREYYITSDYPCGDYMIKIQGKIDGVFELENRFEIEEIKSVVLPAAEFTAITPDHFPEYREQVLFYSYFLQKQHNGLEIVPYLRIVNLVNDKIKTFTVDYNPLEIETVLNKRCRTIIERLEKEDKILNERSLQLQSCNFSLPEERPQQQEMMHAIEDALLRKRHLLVSAPTGTGKTAGALYPAIGFALKNGKKIFFTTAKTTQQTMVRETLLPVSESGLELHTLSLRRNQDMCCNDIFFCHGDYCPYARDYYDRLTASNILEALLRYPVINPDYIFELSKQHTLCPAEVMKDLIPFADIVIGDYNYVFDPAVYLRRLFSGRDYTDWILIIDEAHNLHERGMLYYSPAVNRAEIRLLIDETGNKKQKVFNRLKLILDKIDHSLLEYIQEGMLYHARQACYTIDIDPGLWQSLFDAYEAAYLSYCIYKSGRKIIIRDDPFENFYYRFRHFVYVAQKEAESIISYFSAENKGSLKIQCTDAAVPLGKRINGFYSVIAMSATLDPVSYYKRILGFPDDKTDPILVDSPFPAENRQLILIPNLSTRYRDRHSNYITYAEIVEKIINCRDGNYIVYGPSFDFLQNLYICMGKLKSQIILQRAQMPEKAREEVLSQLADHSHTHILLAVLGGIFAEGIDLRGNTCIGIIIFSPGLPKLSYERELIARYFEEKEGDGFAYAYLYPGINKVIQAAGRLIRSEQDKGIIVLVGDRFAERNVIELLPAYWFKEASSAVITSDYEKVIQAFWKKFDKD